MKAPSIYVRHSPRTHGPRAATAGALLAFALAAITLVPALFPAAGAAPVPQSADLTVWFEDFESAFPGTNWVVADTNPLNGTDYWGPSGQRKAGGNGSAWSASIGDQRLFWNVTGNPTLDPYNTSFESGVSGWTFTDVNPLQGSNDTWGVSSFRYHNGSNSLWCAQEGWNDYASENSSTAHLYDNEMESYASRSVNFSRVRAINATFVTVDFWYFTAVEASIDFLDVVFDNGSGWSIAASFTGNSPGWTEAITTVPADTTVFGFRFYSDSGGVLEGAYVDDIVFSAFHDEPNQGLRIYDLHQNATMWRSVNLTAYATARLDYSYFLDAFSPNDTLSAMYYLGTTWTYTDIRTGSSGGAFQAASVAIPINATRVGFRFLSNATGHREGAYIDNVRIIGHVNSIVCSAQVTPASGYEANTVFTYTVSATQGLLPYTFLWNFNGSTNNTQSAFRTFGSIGVFTGTVNVSDGAGQLCTATAPSVTVFQDTTAVSISPPTTSIMEGGNVSLFGLDRRGHPLSLNWSLSPSSCGSLSSSSGLTVTLRTNLSAGGTTCAVRGSNGTGGSAPNFTATVYVDHNLSAVLLDPPSADVVEGGSVNISATDANGHALFFVWTASCGTLTAYLGPTTTFLAGDNGGNICRVTAILNGSRATANITVHQDTSTIGVLPDFALLVEGGSFAFTAMNLFNHVIDVDWAVTPSACGSMTVAHGNTSVFASTIDSGGLSCTVRASAGAAAGTATVNVTHDISVLALTSGATALREGERTELSLRDLHGHPYSAAWRVDPALCGVLSPTSGGIVNFTASNDGAGIACTVTASVNAAAWRATINISHAAPSEVAVEPAAAAVIEGTGVTLGAAVRDVYGHILNNLTIEWRATNGCAILSVQEGPSTTATPPATDGGKTCVIVASFGNFSATITLTIGYAGPFSITVSPASVALSAGQTQEFTASVVDANGVVPANVSIRWTSTCGGLSSSVGPKVTVTAPSDLGGGSCAVTASIVGAASSASAGGSVTTGMSILIPILIALPIAAGAFLFLRWRKRRPPKFEQIGEGLMDEKKFEVEIR